MALDLNQLSDEALTQIAKYGTIDKALAYLPDADLEKVASYKEPQKMSGFEAGKIGLEKGLTLGLRPAVAGVGEAISQVGGDIAIGKGISESLSKASDSYTRGRKEALAEQDMATSEYPYITGAADIAGSIAPAMALGVGKGLTTGAQKLASALKFGAGQGAAQAVSEAQTIGESAKTIGKGAALGAGAFGVGKGIEKAAPVVGKGVSTLMDYVGDKAKTGFVKVANALTGVTEQNIKTFVDHNDAINKMIQESGGNIGVAADKVREGLSKQIQNFRQSQNQKISEALDKLTPDKTISADPVINALDKMKARINPNLNPEEIIRVEDLMSKIISVSDNHGMVNPKEMYEIQNFLYDSAKGAYMKGGQIFMPGKIEQQAAKAAAREAKIILDKEIPDLRAANEQLSKLHKIEENINKNLIAPGKPEAALLAAGGATTGRNRNQTNLDVLGNILGKDVTGEAQKLSATAAFANPQFMPMSAGGTTSTSRTLMGAATGGILAGPVGGAIGAALTSPAALKQAINAGVISKDVIKQVMGGVINFSDEKALTPLLNFLKTPDGMSVLNRAMQVGAEGNAVQRRISELNNKQGVK